MGTADMGGVKDEEKWKQFFQQMGVQWPIGSSISYLSTIGKLRVTNTSEWLATFEQVLEDLNVTPRLVEIETRFVEVSQNDLNSLGFEWLLNGDFSWSASGFAENVLGLKNFSNNQIPLLDALGNPYQNPDGTPVMGYAPYTKPGQITNPKFQQSPAQYGQIPAPTHNMGMNAIDGTATGYSTGMRYLNTLNNPIVGEGAPVNDKFMRLNAFIGGADVSLILHALCQRSDTDVLSAPKVTTKSGQEAIMKVVTEYIYPSEFNVQISQQGNTGGGLNSGGTGEPIAIVEPQNFTMREVGVILQVVPEVSSEGQMINLTMKPQVVSEPVWKNYGTKLPKTITEPTGILDALGIPIMVSKTEYVELPMEQPFFTVRSVETQLLVYNGATVVMGGLITEERKTMEDKIPFLGDIPYLGRFFQSRSEQSNKRNLLIFVTARLVDPAGRAVRTSGNESSLAAPGGTPMAPTPPPVATPAP
jgi:general secretion pathway protein D